MKRFRTIIPWAFIATLGMVAFIPALAQDDQFQGVTIESLGSITPDNLPGHSLVLLRLTLEPGAQIAAHGHPGAVALFVESGIFGTEFTRGSGQITRASEGSMEPVVEQVSSEAEVLLHARDSLAYGHDAAHTMRNAGDEPLVLLVSALLSSEEPGFLFDESH